VQTPSRERERHESAPHSRRPRPPIGRVWNRITATLYDARFAIAVYVATRALLLIVAIVNGARIHHAGPELANWDGDWYRKLANHGYPTHVSHGYSTLGFFPMFPLTIWLAARPLIPIMHSSLSAITAAGVIVSGVGGLVATVIVQRLAAGWWGESAGRRAVALFCLFPGSVVFSMVYAEGLMLPLVAGCILALQHRRWLLAGILAGFATATEPEAVVLVLVCAVSAGLELRRRGLHDRHAWRSLLAPALSVTGAVAFAAFLWAWTGTPFASYTAQHDAWKEKTDPLALVHLAKQTFHEISFNHFDHPTINLNQPVGLVGAVILLILLVLLLRTWREISIEALVWTLGISFLALTSEYTPPNPRLLFTAFPAVIVLARYLKGRAFGWLLGINGVLLVVMSALTFVSTTLRP
jgi:MFS family permease